MPEPADEINLIQTFSDTKVIGLTINHENMTDADVSVAIVRYQDELGIPVTDALTRPPRILVEMVLSAFRGTMRRAKLKTAPTPGYPRVAQIDGRRRMTPS